jgi:hypothetical protein
MADQHEVRYEDVSQLRSRISWGAILGGAAVAIACYLVLTLFFAGVGLSLTDAGVRDDAIGIGAIVAAVVTIVVAMFVGGWITTQLTAGETKREAMIHGVLCWAAVTAASLALVGMGMRAGYFALVGGSMIATQPNAPTLDEAARAAGIPPERVQQWRADLKANNITERTNDPATRERARETAMWATWGALLGTLLSIGAAIGGALAGCGPTFRLFPVAAAARREIIVSH